MNNLFKVTNDVSLKDFMKNIESNYGALSYYENMVIKGLFKAGNVNKLSTMSGVSRSSLYKTINLIKNRNND